MRAPRARPQLAELFERARTPGLVSALDRLRREHEEALFGGHAAEVGAKGGDVGVLRASDLTRGARRVAGPQQRRIYLRVGAVEERDVRRLVPRGGRRRGCRDTEHRCEPGGGGGLGQLEVPRGDRELPRGDRA